MFKRLVICWIVCVLAFAPMLPGMGGRTFAADGDKEITAESEAAVERGLEWLAKNQGEAGNWESNDLGLVALGALAFLSAGHLPDRGKYGDNVRRVLDYVVANAKPSGLLNISNQDMYNHGLAVFVLTQAYGISQDRRVGEALDKGIKLICDVQCEDGGWDYKAVRLKNGHDLSLAVMQAKALRGAMDIGLEIPPNVVEMAIRSVREHYKPMGKPDGKKYGDHPLADRPGAFTYEGSRYTTAMGACGAVCLQEFGQYGDFRIHRSMDMVIEDINREIKKDPAKPNERKVRPGRIPFDAYTMYYVAQGLYQVGGDRWKTNYPIIRDAIVETQVRNQRGAANGSWETERVGGKPGQLFGTSVAVFALSIPNRYLPILQEGQSEPKNEDRGAGEGELSTAIAGRLALLLVIVPVVGTAWLRGRGRGVTASEHPTPETRHPPVMSFLTGTFLFAMAAAAGPTLIHLLNRRRHRTINWAAMDFLREAVRRNKKLLELRDIILLLVRTLAVALFVLAMAQPFVQSKSTWWIVVAGFIAGMVGVTAMIIGQQTQKKSAMYAGGSLLAIGIALFVFSLAQRDESSVAAYSGEPVHAVIVIDNSLSMGYVELDKSLLGVAKDKARAFIESLPRGSDVSIIPLCDQDDWHLRNVDSTQEDALDTLDQVQIVDRAARAAEGATKAGEALRTASHLLTKRVVFLSDMQRDTWSSDAVRKAFEDEKLGSVQIVQVVPGSAAKRSNSWVADFRLRDGIADAQSPAVFLAAIRHMGEEPRPRVRVALKVSDIVVEEQHIDLQPGQIQRLTFKHKFDSAGTSAEPLFVRARLEIDAKEALQLDNFREIVVPIVAQVPVLFVDQYGEREMPRQGRYGETFLLRRIMTHRAPQQSAADKPLVEARLRSADAVSKEDLKDVRLAVVAGLTSPPPELVQVLREFVEQGGQLFLAAGAEFDPRAWNSVAWQNGAGILPAPLKPEPIGKVPPAAGGASDSVYPTFNLEPSTMRGEAVDLDMEASEQREVFATPFFYKAVGVDLTGIDEFLKAETARLTERRAALAEFETAERNWAQAERSGKLSQADAAKRESSRTKLESMSPRWLQWHNPMAEDEAGKDIDKIVTQRRPRVLGNYDNGEVFAVRRDIGKGRVVMITTGCHPQWNTIAVDQGVLILDQMLLSLLTRSLPDRNRDGVPEISVRVESRDQGARFDVLAPGDKDPVPMRVDPMGENTYGIRLTSIGKRGTYELRRLGVKGDDATVNREWKMIFAVNGPSEESELVSYTQAEFADAMQLPRIRWVGLDGTISLEGEAYIGMNLWKMLMWGAIACLVIEMVFLAMPYLFVKDEAKA